MSNIQKNKGIFTRIFGGAEKNDEDASNNIISKIDRENLVNAAESFHELKVEDVMVPRAEIIAVSDDTDLTNVVKTFIKAGHSRLPVYKETLDEPKGFVHVKDLLALLDMEKKDRHTKAYARQKPLKKLSRPVLFVPASMSANALLKKMQASRVHMALVVDEYGGTDGLVTLEDLIEPIVGDIEDEHDDEEPEIIARKTKSGQLYWDVDAKAEIRDFEQACGFEIATPEQDEEVDSLGGLVFSLAGRVPGRGEIITHPNGMEFEIIDADQRRIKKIRIRAKQDR